MDRARSGKKTKPRMKPYSKPEITLPKDLQDRLSKYVTANTPEVGSSSRSSRGSKSRKSHAIVKVEEPEEVDLFDDDDDKDDGDQSGTMPIDADYVSENEVAQELAQSRIFARATISSDRGSEWDELNASELEGKNNLADRATSRHDDRRSVREGKRPTQTFSSPLAKFSHHSSVPPKDDAQPEGRPTVEELDKFADEMNDSIDSFCNRAKSQVHKFVNRRRQFATK